jgi:hypothetical protein
LRSDQLKRLDEQTRPANEHVPDTLPEMPREIRLVLIAAYDTLLSKLYLDCRTRALLDPPSLGLAVELHFEMHCESAIRSELCLDISERLIPSFEDRGRRRSLLWVWI